MDEKWKDFGLNTGLNIETHKNLLPISLGLKPTGYDKNKDRLNKLRTILGDDKFFKIIIKQDYYNFINRKFLSPSLLTIDIVKVVPLPPPKGILTYFDFHISNK